MDRVSPTSPGTMVRWILFLCSANYYRSRFCEELFNHYSASQGLCWKATSRALLDRPAERNPGPMSPLAVDFLRGRGVEPADHDRLPLQVTDEDFQMCEMIIAVHEAEHRPIVDTAWTLHRESVRYWHVADDHELPYGIALRRLDQHVDTLVRRLRHRQRYFDAEQRIVAS